MEYYKQFEVICNHFLCYISRVLLVKAHSIQRFLASLSLTLSNYVVVVFALCCVSDVE